jgi:hypothetical protein
VFQIDGAQEQAKAGIRRLKLMQDFRADATDRGTLSYLYGARSSLIDGSNALFAKASVKNDGQAE